MRRHWVLLIACLFNKELLAESEVGLWDLSLTELSSVQVSRLATGSPTPLNRAAAITTVITSSEIRKMGASNVDDILMTVPGLYVSRSDQMHMPMYIIRGVYGRFNPQTLFMVNGIAQKNLPVGNRSLMWTGMPVEAIEKVEVIRGPGSALYGADAFAGVINIVTKTNREVEGLQAGARLGSYDTQSAWLQYGGVVSDWDFSTSIEVGTTGGQSGIIREDAQTSLDAIPPGTNASLAPGPINTGNDWLDLFVELSRDEWRFRLGYQLRDEIESGVGVASALDPDSRYRSDRLSFDMTYTQDDWLPNWEFVTQFNAYYDNQLNQNYLELLPPGTRSPVTSSVFPDGALGSPDYEELQVGLQQFGVFTGFINHRVRVALGVNWGDVYKTEEKQNFFIDPNTGLAEPRPEGIVDVSDTADVWLPEQDRKVYFFSLQDEWQLASDWQLVSGVRYDRYSDFGDTINPRMALVWLTSSQLTSRLLYGRAFRAPSFTELYVKSNPVITGNDRLDPETIDTYELAFNYEIESGHYYSLNFFYYKIEDMIEYQSTGVGPAKVATNEGNRHGRGFEFEAHYTFDGSVNWITNYSFQEATDDASHDDVGGAPNSQAYSRVNWPFAGFWNLSTEVHWIGKVQREPTDGREPLKGATVFNMSLRRAQIYKDLELAITVRNLTDKEWSTPSPDLQPVFTPYDYPSPGINGDISVRYQF